MQIDLLTCCGFQLGSELFNLLLIQGNSGHSLDNQDAVIFVIEAAIRIAAQGELTDIALFCENLQEIQHIGMHLSPESLVQNVAPFLLGKIGSGQKLGVFGIFGKDGLQNGKFLQNGLTKSFVF